MARFAFRLPDLGEGVAEAEIVAWHVRVGEVLDEDARLLDLMTDKATVEVTTPHAGTVAALHGAVGDRMPVGTVLVELALDGEDAAPEVAPGAVSVPAPAAAEVAEPVLPEAVAAGPVAAARPAEGAGAAPLAAPATRRRALELGIALDTVPGTGPAGRITPGDLDAFLERREAPARTRAEPRGGVREVRIVGLRRRIAERMELATRRIPHFGYVEAFDLTELDALRRSLNAEAVPGRPKLTLLPFLMRAVALCVPAMPEINARFDDEAGVLHVHEGVHVGIATQTPAGLMVPVVRHVEARDLWDCARELARVSAAARENRASAAELSGSTITLTSLGPLGGLAATPIINHPEVAIIGPNRLESRPVVRNGQVVVREMMNVSSSFDHRIIDGHGAASFIQWLRGLLEQPARLFMAGA